MIILQESRGRIAAAFAATRATYVAKLDSAGAGHVHAGVVLLRGRPARRARHALAWRSLHIQKYRTRNIIRESAYKPLNDKECMRSDLII